jgi:reactive intermediate/imine deaminase
MHEIMTLTYAEAPHPYTPAVAAGDLVFVSGRLGVDDGVFVEGGVEAETTQALKNAAGELAAFGLDLSHVVKATVFLADIDDLQPANRAYSAAFAEPRPARSCVAVAALPFNGRVEIELIASRSRAN